MTDIAITASLPERYSKMLDSISHHYTSIAESNKGFFKSDSQMKMVSLDINDLTDVGAARHILARIENKRAALRESEIAVRRKKVDLDEAHHRLASASGFDADRLEIDILEISSQIEHAVNYQSGAVRELRHLVEQYDLICQRLGVSYISEELFEQDQARYHVIRAFSQALAAARARGGVVDEGNFIYFQDLGINGAVAQLEILAYLEAEQAAIESNNAPTFEMQYEWLMAAGDKYAPEVSRYVLRRGLSMRTDEALATGGGS